MKILACLSEKYIKTDDGYITSPTSAAFLQEAFPKSEICVVSQLVSGEGNEIDSYGSKVEFDQFKEIPFFSSIKDFTIRCVSDFSFYKKFKMSCFKIIDESGCDIIWLRNPSIGSLVFGLCALKRNKPIVNHMCANAMLGWKNEKYSFLEKIFGRMFSIVISLMVNRISRSPNTINVCTGDVLEEICKRKSDKTHQFVDLMITPPKQQINHNKVCSDFLFIGRIQPDKGIYELCEAVSKTPKCRLTIVGYGQSYDDIVSRFVSFPNINILGKMKHSELGNVLSQSDCVVVPSKNNYEGFPRVIMEAWSYGKPVIVADAGGVKAFVRHGFNSIVINNVTAATLQESITNLNEDSSLYNTLLEGTSEMKSVSDKNYWLAELRKIVNYG